MSIGKENIPKRNFIASDTQPPIKPKMSRRKAIVGLILFGMVTASGVGYLANRDDNTYEVPVVTISEPVLQDTWVDPEPAPTHDAAEIYNFGTRVEVGPVDGMTGFFMTAFRNGTFLFENNTDKAVSINDLSLVCVMPDGDYHFVDGTDTWGVTIQPKEEFKIQLDTYKGCTLEARTEASPEDKTIVRWKAL